MRHSVRVRSSAQRQRLHARAVPVRPCQRFCVMLSETGSDHLHTIAEEVCRVAGLCIGQDMGHDERGHGVPRDGSRQRELSLRANLGGANRFMQCHFEQAKSVKAFRCAILYRLTSEFNRILSQ